MFGRKWIIFFASVFCLRAEAAAKLQFYIAPNCGALLIDKSAQTTLFHVKVPTVQSSSDEMALHLLRFMLPQLFGPFRTTKEANDGSRQIAKFVVQAVQFPFSSAEPLYRRVVGEAAALGAFGFQNLWARVGLGEAYNRFVRHTGHRKFWRSGLTLVQIYEELYRSVVNGRYRGSQNSYAYWSHVEQFERVPGYPLEELTVKRVGESSLLVLKNASDLPVGQVVWTPTDRHAIVGVNADLTRQWYWGLRPPSVRRDLTD